MNGENLLYYYISFFMIYAFLGWCVEVIYATIVTRKFLNRGFLNGPICPIYGFGVITILLLLGPFKDNLVKLFIYSTLIVSSLEYTVGFALEKIFNNKWWDYSEKKFNLNGYIALRFSLLWGLACVLVIRYIHPVIEMLVIKIPKIVGYPILAILIIFLLIDILITVMSINGLNKRLSQLEEITFKIKSISNELGENIYETTSNILDKNDKFKEKLDKKREVLDELLEKQKNLIKEKKITHSRIIKAFPTMESKRFSEALRKLQESKNEQKNL